MEVTQLEIGGSVLRRRLIPTKDTHFYGDSFLRRRLIFYTGDWFSQRMFILTGVTHVHRGHIFYEGDSFPRKHSFLRSRLLSKAETNEWVARNRVLVIAQRFLGSPQGEHCNSLEKRSFRLFICSHFLPEFPRSSFSWQDPSKSSRRKEAAQKPLDFSRQTITWPMGFLFHRLFHSSKGQQLSKNNFHLRWRRRLSFEEAYFQTSQFVYLIH